MGGGTLGVQCLIPAPADRYRGVDRPARPRPGSGITEHLQNKENNGLRFCCPRGWPRRRRGLTNSRGPARQAALRTTPDVLCGQHLAILSAVADVSSRFGGSYGRAEFLVVGLSRLPPYSAHARQCSPTPPPANKPNRGRLDLRPSVPRSVLTSPRQNAHAAQVRLTIP